MEQFIEANFEAMRLQSNRILAEIQLEEMLNIFI